MRYVRLSTLGRVLGVAACCLAFVSTSCSDDDDERPPPPDEQAAGIGPVTGNPGFVDDDEPSGVGGTDNPPGTAGATGLGGFDFGDIGGFGGTSLGGSGGTF